MRIPPRDVLLGSKNDTCQSKNQYTTTRFHKFEKKTVQLEAALIMALGAKEFYCEFLKPIKGFCKFERRHNNIKKWCSQGLLIMDLRARKIKKPNQLSYPRIPMRIPPINAKTGNSENDKGQQTLITTKTVFGSLNSVQNQKSMYISRFRNFLNGIIFAFFVFNFKQKKTATLIKTALFLLSNGLNDEICQFCQKNSN